MKKYLEYIKENKDIDPYNEEIWEEDVVGKSYYYIYSRDRETPFISKVYCRSLSPHHYFSFSLDNNRNEEAFIHYTHNVNIVNKPIDINPHHHTYFIPIDNEDMFKLVSSMVFNEWKDKKLDEIRNVIKAKEIWYERVSNFKIDDYLKQLRENKLCGNDKIDL